MINPRSFAGLVVAVSLGAVSAAGEVATRPSQAAGLAAALAAEDRDALVAEVARAGDAREGANLFHTRQLTCTLCHVAGAGASPLGPNLAAMPEGVPRERLVPHLIESLLAPSAVISPAYRGVTLVTADGRSRSGIIARETDEEVVLRDAAAGGRETVVRKDEIEERVATATSLMPEGLVNLLADRQQFVNLVRYLTDVAERGAAAAEKLAPDPTVFMQQAPPAYEDDIDHAGFIADWQDPQRSKAALERGGAIFARVCANCHGTLDAPGSLPTAPRFAEGKFKAGSDPFSMYRTLTHGAGLMVAQDWMVPSQKYDVIHFIRETFLKDRNRDWHTAITPGYLGSLPHGRSRGPEPAAIEPWRTHDYGPFLAGTFEVGQAGGNVARKGLAVRLDPGPGGVGRGHAWILYELDTLRAAAFWTGDRFIDWGGINFDGRHGAHPRVAGDVQAALATMPGWAAPGADFFADPRPRGRDQQPYGPLPRERGRFRALHHATGKGSTAADPRSAVVLDYLVGETTVLESPGLAPPLEADGAAKPVLVRAFSLAPRSQPLTVRLAAAPAAAALVGPRPADTDDRQPRVVSRDGHVDLVIPAGDGPLDVAVAVAAADPARLATHAAGLAAPPAPRSFVAKPAPPLWATPVETAIAAGPDSGPFVVDTFAPPGTNPWNAQVRFSGLDFTAADEAVLCTWDGDAWTVSGIGAPHGQVAWRRIASGLFQPLGIKVIGGVVHVGCRDRIVKLVDLDGDGMTDRYDTFNDDHQVTEHFHEFAMGLETDAAGNVYYAKSGCHGLPAAVPHHGTLLEVAPDGSTTKILATGFRAANGVCVEDDGTFWVTDQEGFWCPKNRINRVRRGGFYGNMWGWTDVTDASDAAMEPPAFWITNAFDRSPAELVRVKGERWAPLTGSLLELSYGMGRIHLVLTEPAPARPGHVQGGMVALPIPDLPTGIMRGRFRPADGQLYACGLFAWAGNRTQPGGFFRVRRTERPLTIPVALHAEPGAITLTFPEPLDRATATDPEAWTVKTWALERSQHYGSKHLDEQARAVDAVELSSDGSQVTLRVPGFKATWCYAVKWVVKAADGTPLRGALHGTMH
jgi:putative heme-binding domain-containing protein